MGVVVVVVVVGGGGGTTKGCRQDYSIAVNGEK